MNSRACRILALGLAVQLGMALYAQSASAQSRETINIWVRAVAASSAGKRIDPALQGIRRQLGNLFRYTSYTLISEMKQRAAFGQAVHMNLSSGRRLTITPFAFDKGMIQMSLNIMEENRVIFNTNVRLADQGTLLIGGPSHGEGVIIFAISASVR